MGLNVRSEYIPSSVNDGFEEEKEELAVLVHEKMYLFEKVGARSGDPQSNKTS
jgi:hypothetical protein